MTDSDDPTGPQGEVRRLLAESRHTEPMPDAVVERLDRALARLAAEPARTAPVPDIATRRRRAATLLVAAAAAVVIGVGVGQVVESGTGDAESLTTADRAADGGAEAAERAEGGLTEEEAPPADVTELDSQGASAGPVDRLTRAGYDEALLDLRTQLRPGPAPTSGSVDDRGAFLAAGRACRSDTWGPGRFVPVRYAGAPAVVVFRRARGDTQVVDLFRCGDSEPRRSVTLPAP